MTSSARARFPFAVVSPLNATMPGCRAPIPSKGKQRFWALSSVERSIELTTAVVKPFYDGYIYPLMVMDSHPVTLPQTSLSHISSPQMSS